MNNLFDGQFNGLARGTMYRSWVFPDISLEERPAVLQNWCQDDLEMFCGGAHTPGYACN
jgi:hypothetical protein